MRLSSERLFTARRRVQDNKVTVTVHPVYPRIVKDFNAIVVIKILFIPARKRISCVIIFNWSVLQ